MLAALGLVAKVLELTVDDSAVYFTTSAQAPMALDAVSITGGPIMTLLSGQNRIDRLTEDDDYVNFIDSAGGLQASQAIALQACSGGGDVEPRSSGCWIASPPSALVAEWHDESRALDPGGEIVRDPRNRMCTAGAHVAAYLDRGPW
jgi:hypothetical protein